MPGLVFSQGAIWYTIQRPTVSRRRSDAIVTASLSASSTTRSQELLGETHRSLRESITDEIRRAILSGRYAPGARLVEDRLANEYGVSRNPVREALRSLEGEGLVEVVPRRGAMVVMFSNEEVREIIELRASLEGLSARLAARRGDDSVRAVIRDLLVRGNAAAAADDQQGLLAINDEFHRLIAVGGQNRFLADFVRTIRDKTYWLAASTRGWRRRMSWDEHAGILQAVLDRDEDMAGQLASGHVVNAGRAYLDEFRDGGGEAGAALDAVEVPSPAESLDVRRRKAS